MTASDPRGRYPHAYGALAATVRMFLAGTINRDQLAEWSAEIAADLHGTDAEATS